MTLTEMLKEALYHTDYKEHYSEKFMNEQLAPVKEVFKEWLKTVGLPDLIVLGKHGDATFNATEATRKLLMTLVDEP